jgi:aspartyl-tRNA(Asn)/glutamyl-tRNA(Gln) amidotransferase subunit C
MQIDLELVQKLAKLSGLRVEATEEEAIRLDLQKMLDFVNRLNEVDTSGVDPLLHMSVRDDAERDDIIENSFTNQQALLNAKNADTQYFRVPKVIKK